MRRVAQLMAWQERPSPAALVAGKWAAGRGMAYIHYKHNETFVAVAMEVEVDRGTGEIAVRRVCCAHDCGLMINPDAVRAQVEGNILQTLSRTLYEETTFDRSRVASFPAMPKLEIALIDRRDQPPLGAVEAASSPVRPRSRTRCSMRRACGCATCRSAATSSRRCGPERPTGRRSAAAL